MKNTTLLYILKSEESEFVVKNENVTLVLMSIHQRNIESKIRIRLTESGGSATVVGIIIASGSSTIRIHTMQEHQAPNTTSNLLIKTALYNESRSIVEGGIRVEKNAQKTDAYQRNENLLMSGKTHAESMPSLEILADDVRCTHGATVGPISEEELWYLATRGVPRAFAEQLIVQGFFGKALERIDDENIRHKVWNSILKSI